MSAKFAFPNLQTTTAPGSTDGYLTFANAKGYAVGARAFLRDSSGLNPVEVQVTAVTAVSVGVVAVSQLPYAYGRTDFSSYLTGSTLDQYGIQVTPFGAGVQPSSGVQRAFNSHLYLLEILSTRSNAPAFPVATGSLTAVTGQVVTCTRAESAYCWDGTKLVYLGPNTVRVEGPNFPGGGGNGLLVEPASTNALLDSVQVGKTPNWSVFGSPTSPTVTLNSTDLVDPAGGHEATRFDFPTVPNDGSSYSFFSQDVGGTTLSVWARTLTGTATLYLADNTTNTTSTMNITSSWQRFTLVRASPATNFWILGCDTRVTNGHTPGISACTVYFWGSNSESLPYPTSVIRTVGTGLSRSADLYTVHNPLSDLPQIVNSWLGQATVTPSAPWDTNFGANSRGFLDSPQPYDPTSATHNAWHLYLYNAGNALYSETRDNAGGQRYRTGAPALTGTTPHTFTITDTGTGSIGVLLDGVDIGSGSSGGGTGVISVHNATVSIGNGNSTDVRAVFGWMRDIIVDGSGQLAPALSLSPGNLTFSATQGGSNPASQVESISNSSGSGTLNSITTSIVYHSGSGWLGLTPGGSGNSQSITVQPTTGALIAATYTATVSVLCSNASNTPQTFDVSFTVNSPFTPPPNTKFAPGDTPDMTGWFLHVGVTTALNVADYQSTPNGANTITATAGGNAHTAYSNSSTAGYTTVGGAFKAGTVNFVSLCRNDSQTDYAFFDLSVGTVTSVGTAVGTIHSLGGGWYWCSITLTTSVQTFTRVQIGDTSAHTDFGNWTAVGTETIFAGPFSAQ